MKHLLKSFLLLCALVAGSGSVWADTVTFDYADYKEQGTTSTGSDYTMVKTDVSIGDTKFFGNNSQAHFYANGTTTITPASGVTITQIVLTATAEKYNGYQSSGTVTPSTGSASASGTTVTWTGSATKAFTIEHNKQIRWTSIVVTYTKSGGGDASTVSTPSFSSGSGNYTTALNVTLTCATEGATIYYTMTEDSTTPDDPTESDAEYSTPISVTKSGTIIKAKAFKSGLTASPVVTATYTIKPNKPTVTAMGPTVTISGDDGCTFYYTTNGDTPDNTKTEYAAPFTLDADCTIKAIAYDAYSNASDVETSNYVYMPLIPKNANTGYYVKVTDASTLENGDAILIVNETAGKALGPQSGNNCPEKAVTITDGVISDKGDALKLILVKKTEKISDVDTEVFYFYTGDGYLYAASNSSNYLKEQDPATTNARATIEIESGNATITFKGSYTRNLLRYNSTSNLFSCYASGQEVIQIYKEVVPITISSAGWATFSSTNEVEIPAGVTAYYAQKKDGSTVTLKEIEGGYIPANTGVVVSGAANTYVANVTTSGATLAETNLLKPWTTAGEPTDETYYTLAVDGESKPVFKLSTGGTLAAGKAYLVMPAGARELSVDFGGETTGVNEELRMKNEESSAAPVYNLNGQRVSQPTRGLYIVNGKKVVVK